MTSAPVLGRDVTGSLTADQLDTRPAPGAQRHLRDIAQGGP